MKDLMKYWTLDPEVTFLNHGSFGACPIPILEKQTAFRAELEREPVRFMVKELPQYWQAALDALAAFINADAEGLAFVTNATTGVNAVLRSLDLTEGDELLCTNHEYNACRNALEWAAERTGARVVIVDLPFPLQEAGEITQSVLSAVTAKTKLLLIDHVTSPTALILPLEDIIPALKAQGVRILVDGAHALGMMPLDLQKLAPDYYTSNAHKWLCTPKGSAFLWAAPEHRESVRPCVISHGANAPTETRSRYRWEFDWQGTSDPTPWLCIPEAIQFMGSLFDGWEGLRAHNNALALKGRDIILEALGTEAPCPDDMIACMSTISIGRPAPRPMIDHFDTPPLQQWLDEQHKIQVPFHLFPTPEEQWLRISAQAYNTIEDYEKLAAALVEGLNE